MDPYQALTIALSQPANSPAQAAALQATTQIFEAHPQQIEHIVLPLIDAIKGNPDSTLKRWVLQIVAFAVGRSHLLYETKLFKKVLPALSVIISDTSSPIVTKLAARIAACIYPMIYRSIATATITSETLTKLQQQWTLMTQIKTIIITFALAISIDPATLGQPRDVNPGLRIASWKFVQRVICDRSDSSLDLCPPDHPVIRVGDLEIEAQQMADQLAETLKRLADPSILYAMLNIIPPLLRLRPNLANSLIQALHMWSPDHMIAARIPPSQIRSVEKTLKIAMVHLRRIPIFATFGAQLQDAQQKQNDRVIIALKEERAEREAKILQRAQEEAQRAAKRALEQPEGGSEGTAVKRARTRSPVPPGDVSQNQLNIRPNGNAAPGNQPPFGELGTGIGAYFDTTTLGFELATDMLMTSLNAIDAERLTAVIHDVRRRIPSQTSQVMNALRVALGPEDHNTAGLEAVSRIASDRASMPARFQEDEPDEMLLDPNDQDSAIPSGALLAKVQQEYDAKDEDLPIEDPLNVLADEEEADLIMEVTPEELEEEEDLLEDEVMPFHFANFTLPKPKTVTEETRQKLMLSAIERIYTGGQHVGQNYTSDSSRFLGSDNEESSLPAGAAVTTKDPSKSREDKIRQSICDFVLEDFSNRMKLASVWLNEEWFNGKVADENAGTASAYNTWLGKVLSATTSSIGSDDTTLVEFLLDLPELTPDVLLGIRRIAENVDTAIAGVTTLRDIINLRPPVRDAALQILLDLTTHPERKIRVFAINTVKRWVPVASNISPIVTNYALQMVRRLGQSSSAGTEAVKSEDEEVEEGEEEEEPVESTYVPAKLELPLAEGVIQQHVELLLALSVRNPDLLETIFSVYQRLDPSIQDSLNTILTPLIRSLGPNHAKLLGILRHFPPGAEKLALRIMQILTPEDNTSPGLVATVKGLLSERQLDPRFMIPIAGEMDKAELYRYLPRMVSILCGKAPERDMIKQVFRKIVFVPDRRLLSTNEVRQNMQDQLLAADLLVLLHQEQASIGLQAAIEEVFAVVMQRIIDSTTLPLLFMRTVLRAVTTYRSLIGYVSTTLLSRLITKKVWTNPQLWVGFMRCAKTIAPASFSALMQLPREQLKEILERQPEMKPGLWQYVLAKNGPVKAQTYAELFGMAQQQNATPDHGAPAPQAIPSFS
ncbi:hypothetical protein QFC20_002305 [Naganishia adeliensis]|uniref:Uncharacterized protein n=1 Tax=Naganishia adeliensis TaxID=92952 RepID=A0ACC2WLT9_9TREE|nr:hypothetical protein QFC20_002305 [Naganishia adeliensis]